jgi:pantetheine-phosphate adenylyltransferase
MSVYEISDDDRERLRDPHGMIVQGQELIQELQHRDYHRLICVGDRVSHDAVDAGIAPDICVIDGKIERDPVETQFEDGHNEAAKVLETVNDAGQISEDAWNTVRTAVAHTCQTTVTVDGEEDLLALPAILFAAPDSLVVHGHWQEGAIILQPDAAMKQFVQDLVGIEPYPRLIVGGTWDRFHAGHRYLLLAALENGNHIDVGVTTAAFASEQREHEVAPFDDRKHHVDRFMETFGHDDADIMAIDDFRGNAVDVDQAVLLATDETMENAKQINAERLEQGKTPLKIASLDRIKAEDGGDISATRIRAGDIDQNGFIL